MCIIIYRPRGAEATISDDVFDRCARMNPDGFGLMWNTGNRLRTRRYVTSERKVFRHRFMTLQASDAPFVAHFRYATHGTYSRRNAHPYIIHNHHSALVHNGILSYPAAPGWSDTRTFVADVIRKLPLDWWDSPHLRWLIEEATIGNKLVIMQADGRVIVIHERAGIWDKGIWYSNAGYRPWGYGIRTREPADERPSVSTRTSEFVNRFIGASQSLPPRIKPGLIAPPKNRIILPVPKALVQKEEPHLYRYDGLLICEDCLRIEVGAMTKAIPVMNPEPDDECALCPFHASIGK